MTRITHDLKDADRTGTVCGVLGSLVIGMLIVAFEVFHGVPAWAVVFFAVLAVGLWILAITEINRAANLKWVLTWWGRQKRETQPKVEESKTKDIDSIEAIKKLAELRDKGILTQEEFEQKKKKLL